MMTLFWAMRHAMDQFEARHAANEARTATRTLDARVRALESLCSQSMLVSEAIWSLVRDKLGLSDDELVDRVNEIDLSDGKLDGKVRRSVSECPKCGRTVSPRFKQCMYCGCAIEKTPFA